MCGGDRLAIGEHSNRVICGNGSGDRRDQRILGAQVGGYLGAWSAWSFPVGAAFLLVALCILSGQKCTGPHAHIGAARGHEGVGRPALCLVDVGKSSMVERRATAPLSMVTGTCDGRAAYGKTAMLVPRPRRHPEAAR
jgi:hypothetical protein